MLLEIVCGKSLGYSANKYLAGGLIVPPATTSPLLLLAVRHLNIAPSSINHVSLQQHLPAEEHWFKIY